MIPRSGRNGWMLGLLALCAAAHATPEIGEIVYASGKTEVVTPDGRTEHASPGTRVKEGTTLRTGSDGYLYLRTDDGGFFILRPGSRGSVHRYRVGMEKERSEFRLELEEGISRVITGRGPKLAPDRFRFNTPIAAIGVRGTDFTVMSNASSTRAWVDSGQIVLSPLGEKCPRSSFGPCDGEASLELSPATLRAAEVRADMPIPRPLPPEEPSPDKIIPRGPAEPNGGNSANPHHNGRATPAEIALAIPLTTPEPQPTTLRWGRWQALADAPATLDPAAAAAAGAQMMAIGPFHAIFRENNPALILPQEGRVEFALAAHEGSFYNELTGENQPARATQAVLRMDFAARRFSTTLSLVGEKFPGIEINAQGTISNDGRFYSAPLSVSHIAGVVGGTAAQEAAYLYQTRVNRETIVAGATYWRR